MTRRLFLAVLAICTMLVATGSSPESLQSYLNHYDPLLIRKAAEVGLYDRSVLPISREMNPYYIRGDFDGDSEMDIAFWVTESGSSKRGIAIVHSTLDTLYVFGAGRSRPSGGVQNDQVWVDIWHLFQPSLVVDHPHGEIPEIGLVEGRPFKFERETLSFVHLAKSAFVFYWAKGQYWEIWIAD